MFCIYSCTQVQSWDSQCAKEQRAAYCLEAAHDTGICPRYPTQVPNPAHGRALGVQAMGWSSSGFLSPPMLKTKKALQIRRKSTVQESVRGATPRL